MFAWISKTYYRYTTMTGLYMLGREERLLLHLFLFLFSLAFFRLILLDFMNDVLGIKLVEFFPEIF
jgi:hypothetical protein